MTTIFMIEYVGFIYRLLYSNTSYGTNRFMWDGINKGEVPIGTGSVTDENGNVFTLGAQVSHPYADLWYYEICVNTP
ncbi:hypothetical protein [Shewanella baltica]|uniref:hypothetical protein n=1 Tax=Shewanella baltica TaxID=62322 RepID=UPI000E0241EF|nr:hypothetical protein [Shewanella baltica]SUI45826.1 Uncharacterised protein [Shewanella baltica]